jgi:hypothetical protein
VGRGLDLPGPLWGITLPVLPHVQHPRKLPILCPFGILWKVHYVGIINEITGHLQSFPSICFFFKAILIRTNWYYRISLWMFLDFPEAVLWSWETCWIQSGNAVSEDSVPHSLILNNSLCSSFD